MKRCDARKMNEAHDGVVYDMRSLHSGPTAGIRFALGRNTEDNKRSEWTEARGKE